MNSINYPGTLNLEGFVEVSLSKVAYPGSKVEYAEYQNSSGMVFIVKPLTHTNEHLKGIIIRVCGDSVARGVREALSLREVFLLNPSSVFEFSTTKTNEIINLVEVSDIESFSPDGNIFFRDQEERFNIKDIGPLYLVEDLDYYDGPLTTVLRNSRGEFFIANCFSRGERYHEWMITEISARRLRLLYDGNVSNREIFEKSEGDVFEFLEWFKLGGPYVLAPTDLDDSKLWK